LIKSGLELEEDHLALFVNSLRVNSQDTLPTPSWCLFPPFKLHYSRSNCLALCSRSLQPPFEARLLLSHALRPFIKLFALPSRFHLSDRRNLSQRQLLTRTSISTSWIFGATFPVSLQTSKHVNTVQPCIFDCSSSPHDSHRRKRLFTAPIRRSLLCTSKHVCVSWTLHEWTRFNTSPRTGSRTPWNHRQICSLRPMRSSPA
jgi:hypothetical protein